MAKCIISAKDREVLDTYIKSLPIYPKVFYTKNNPEGILMKQKTYHRGRYFIAKGIKEARDNKTGMMQEIHPDHRYIIEDYIFMNPGSLLLSAFIRKGKDGLVEACTKYLKDHEKSIKLRLLEEGVKPE